MRSWPDNNGGRSFAGAGPDLGRRRAERNDQRILVEARSEPRPGASSLGGGWQRLLVALAGFAAAAAVRGEPTFYQTRIAPILERHCVDCHGAEKQKGKLRLDSWEGLMKGAESGEVVKPGDLKGSELFRRITLPQSEEEVMPGDGKPPLSANEIKNLELWIAGGASAVKVVADFPDAPALSRPVVNAAPLAPDWRPRAAEIAALEKALGVRLVARSLVPTDGLILRTASAPGRCDDAALARLAPVAELIVVAELARTRVTDTGLAALSAWENLRSLDLTRTPITTQGLETLTALRNLESLNLTDTAVDDSGMPYLRALPSLKHLWLFGTKTTVDVPGTVRAN